MTSVFQNVMHGKIKQAYVFYFLRSQSVSQMKNRRIIFIVLLVSEVLVIEQKKFSPRNFRLVLIKIFAVFKSVKKSEILCAYFAVKQFLQKVKTVWMETSAAVLLFAPILAPIAVAMGVHPVHFAVVMIVNLTIGLITPPVGVVLYATSSVGQLKFERVVKSTMPLILLAVVILLLVTFIPELSLFLPWLLGFID